MNSLQKALLEQLPQMQQTKARMEKDGCYCIHGALCAIWGMDKIDEYATMPEPIAKYYGFQNDTAGLLLLLNDRLDYTFPQFQKFLEYLWNTPETLSLLNSMEWLDQLKWMQENGWGSDEIENYIVYQGNLKQYSMEY